MAFLARVPTPRECLVLAHARCGHPEELLSMLSEAADGSEAAALVEARGAHGTPLVEACRAAPCTPLHVLAVQALLGFTHTKSRTAIRADVDATDCYGATALMWAALRCSVLTEDHLSHPIPAPGIDPRAVLPAACRICADACESTPPRSAATLASEARTVTPQRYTPDASETSGRTSACRCGSTCTCDASPPRLSSASLAYTHTHAHTHRPLQLRAEALPQDELARRLQLITMLLNARCDVRAATRNGVTAAMLLCACVYTQTHMCTSVLESVLESTCAQAGRRQQGVVSRPPGPARRASELAASLSSEDGLDDASLCVCDCAGANMLHYAAYACNTACVRMLMRVLEPRVLRQLSMTRDKFDRLPVDVVDLAVDADTHTHTQTATGTEAPSGQRPLSKRASSSSNVTTSLASRRKEMRTLLSLL